MHPASFYGYMWISSLLSVLAWAGFFLHPAVGLLFGCLALILFVVHFVMYKPVIDPLFPRRSSTNVTAVRPCKGEVRQRVFLNGHIDAAWEFPLNYYFNGFVFETPPIISYIGLISLVILEALDLFGLPFVGKLIPFGAIFLPFFLLVAITYNPLQVVDGANDNLSGCYMGIALLREMQLRGIDFEHTEVGILLTGSEEAGLRGAKAWSARHKEDYNDVPTYVICFDTIHDPRYLAVNEKDLNGTLEADPKLSEMLLRAAEAAGVPCNRDLVPLFGGATDSAAFTQAGFRSVGITGLNHNLEDYYHTRRDSWDNMNREGLDNCYRMTVKLLEMMDKK